MSLPELHLLDSITDIGRDHAGGIAVSGSHGGLYPATVASRYQLRAVVLNDAGIGFDEAGVAGILALGEVGMAAAAADCMTCLIGSAKDTFQNGCISCINDIAEDLGLRVGMRVSEAIPLLRAADRPAAMLPPMSESRRATTLGSGLAAALLDSASLVGPEDDGAVVITGSHGALIGGDPARALKADARVAVFNDAGVGKNGIGRTRLPALDNRGIAAVTVSHTSARIGDAQSALDTGLISACNDAASRLGAREGELLSDWLDDLKP